MGDDAIIIIAVVVALMIVGWLLYLAAGLVLLFTAFVMELPTILAIVMFIIFPPTLIVFLVGLAFVHFGIADAMARADSAAPKRTDGDAGKEGARRRALGYDE